eukprot:6210554-Pleurochrysis_carterae.AAC.3
MNQIVNTRRVAIGSFGCGRCMISCLAHGRVCASVNVRALRECACIHKCELEHAVRVLRRGRVQARVQVKLRGRAGAGVRGQKRRAGGCEQLEVPASVPVRKVCGRRAESSTHKKHARRWGTGEAHRLSQKSVRERTCAWLGAGLHGTACYRMGTRVSVGGWQRASASAFAWYCARACASARNVASWFSASCICGQREKCNLFQTQK